MLPLHLEAHAKGEVDLNPAISLEAAALARSGLGGFFPSELTCEMEALCIHHRPRLLTSPVSPSSSSPQ
jgi:hypothetical protein